MSAVAVKKDLLNVARLFGDVDTVVSDAVRRYAIDRSVERIESARAKVRGYEQGYGVAYKIFDQKIQTDARFLQRVESRHPLWEEDAIEWKYRTEEVEEWTKTLESILKQ
jgi:hypothetical protein